MTSTPCLISRFCTRPMARSFPEISREENEGIAPLQHDFWMIVGCDPGQSGARLPLAAGADQNDLFPWQETGVVLLRKGAASFR